MSIDKENNNKIKDLKEIWLNNSAKRFQTVSMSNNTKKFDKLPQWLDKVSSRYEQENNNTSPEKYYYYKRETIIRVDFGVNMGSKFCGLHFAVVLDKKDTSKRRTLIVVPLTSKEKKDHFFLGKEIFNQTVTILDKRKHNILAEAKILSQKEKDFKLNHTYNPEEIIKDVKKLEKDVSDMQRVITIYDNYNKNSYVRLQDITTISKFRINRINKFDPSGKIKLNEQQMRSISNELKKLYLTE